MESSGFQSLGVGESKVLYSFNNYLVVFVLVRNEGYITLLWQISQAGVVQHLAVLQHRQTQGKALQLLLELETLLLLPQIQVA